MGITDSNITTSNILKNFFVVASGLEVCRPCRLVEQRLSTNVGSRGRESLTALA